MPHQDPASNKYREAAKILERGRERLLGGMADEVLHQGEDLLEHPFLLNEFLESQGTRLHFLTLVLGQFELSAELEDEREAAEVRLRQAAAKPKAPPKPRVRKPRAKKVAQKASADGTPGEA